MPSYILDWNEVRNLETDEPVDSNGVVAQSLRERHNPVCIIRTGADMLEHAFDGLTVSASI